MSDPHDDLMTETRLASKATRPFWFALGWLAVALAAAGAVLPILTDGAIPLGCRLGIRQKLKTLAGLDL